uniref:Cilia and flagella associated protein 54 n=1 Tax=Cyprinus carpio TaxID=7962 RepID=A0A8C2G2Q6_CYPCA
SNGRKHSSSQLARAVWIMDPAPASYYGPLDKNNPVLLAFQSDLKEFKGKKAENSNFISSLSIKLFETWNKYKSRLPASYFEEHLLQTADFLLYSKFRALQGECQCIFYLEKERNALPDQSAVQNLLSILGFVRILMQAVLPDESLCWILYNGSLYMYNICRFLMSAGHASQVLEYLLWACTCLETSVPLLTANFLPWRATLYCAVCECYFHECVFARRALGKTSELAKLEEMTGSQVSLETQQAFKEATIKLAVMVFKRSVYEPRRKPKGLFRPKQKSNLKELHLTPWPRTPTERILMEMFEGNAARFLAVLEALGDSSVRPLQTGMPEEFEVQDVVLELISAGTSLLSGTIFHPLCLCSKIAVDAAVKFVKQVFRYEQWSTFSSLSAALISALAVSTSVIWLKMSARLLSSSFSGTVHRTWKADIQPDADLVLDIVLFFWAKCKTVFQRAQSRHYDPVRYLGRVANQDQVIIQINSKTKMLTMRDFVDFKHNHGDAAL